MLPSWTRAHVAQVIESPQGLARPASVLALDATTHTVKLRYLRSAAFAERSASAEETEVVHAVYVRAPLLCAQDAQREAGATGPSPYALSLTPEARHALAHVFSWLADEHSQLSRSALVYWLGFNHAQSPAELTGMAKRVLRLVKEAGCTGSEGVMTLDGFLHYYTLLAADRPQVRFNAPLRARLAQGH